MYKMNLRLCYQIWTGPCWPWPPLSHLTRQTCTVCITHLGKPAWWNLMRNSSKWLSIDHKNDKQWLPHRNKDKQTGTYWGKNKMTTIMQMYFNAFYLMKMYEFQMKSHWNAEVTGPYLNHWWPDPLTNLSISGSQWVNDFIVVSRSN